MTLDEKFEEAIKMLYECKKLVEEKAPHKLAEFIDPHYNGCLKSKRTLEAYFTIVDALNEKGV